MKIIVEQIRNLRLLKKAAAVYLLFRYFGRPLRVIDVSRLLEISRETARYHVRSLISLGLVARPKLTGGFALTDKGRQFLPGEFSAEREDFLPPVNTVVVKDSYLIKESKSRESLTTTTNKPEEIPPEPEEIPPESEEIPPAEGQAVWDALEAAGIVRNARIEQLARQDYLTPDYVTGHYLSLKSQGKGDRTGLLVTILESGLPAPPLNANRHLRGCDCPECQMLKYRACPYCGEYPCQCEEV